MVAEGWGIDLTLTYTEIIVRGKTPQLPMSDGLTIARSTPSSRVHKASLYICSN